MNAELRDKIAGIVTDIAKQKFKDKIEHHLNYILENSAKGIPERMQLDVICESQSEIVLKLSWGNPKKKGDGE